ncbi:hypothetical protein EDB87DRAFT_1679289 [Lactarius vividus]|nr:hypothetical protein EDB87DRAFT_1679289 [Lactarius vividus]
MPSKREFTSSLRFEASKTPTAPADAARTPSPSITPARGSGASRAPASAAKPQTVPAATPTAKPATGLRVPGAPSQRK